MQTNFVVYTVDTIAFQRSLSVLICIIVMNNKRYPNASVPSLHFSTPSSYVILPLIPMCSVHSAGCLVLLLRSRNLQSSELLTSPRLSRIAYPRARATACTAMAVHVGCGVRTVDCDAGELPACLAGNYTGAQALFRLQRLVILGVRNNAYFMVEPHSY